ncbi:MAG: hypothetical protein AAGA42_21480 [Actinomycetota bacterium]
MKAAAFALVVAVVGALAPAAASSSASARSAAPDEEAAAGEQIDESCTDADGVTVVVDFQELGGGVNVRCAPGPIDSGLDAFNRADIVWEGTRRDPGFVCRIAGRPGPVDEACGNTPPANAYWSYWLAPRGGTWCYSNLGAGNRTPPPGTVEGWSFALNRATTEIPPPRLDPPPPLPGVEPTQLDPGDCSTPNSSATTISTTQAPTSSVTTPPTAADPPPAAVAPSVADPVNPSPPADQPTGDSTGSDPSGDSTGQPAESDAVDELAEGATDASVSPVDVATTTTNPGSAVAAAPAGTATSSTRPPVTRPETTTARSSEIDLDRIAADRELPSGLEAPVPVGDVDLSDDGRGGGGFGATTLLGMLAIAALAGGGFWAARRRGTT